MRDFVITVNSTVDLPREWLEERNVPVVPLKYTIDGETYTDMYGLSAKEFFDKLREGHMSVTSQVNPGEAADMLEPFLKEGKDVLHLGFSSGLSGTLNSMKIAGEELSEKFDISTSALKQCFKGVYGSAIYTYMRNYRMDLAASLLTQTDEPITMIAGKVGYTNTSKFSEAFKKVKGKTPLEYRKVKI